MVEVVRRSVFAIEAPLAFYVAGLGVGTLVYWIKPASSNWMWAWGGCVVGYFIGIGILAVSRARANRARRIAP